MDFSLIGQLFYNGLTIGLIYVILGAGLVLILSVSEIFFVAYGQFYLIGAYMAWYAVKQLNLPYFAGLVFAVIATTALGILLYVLIFKRIRRMKWRILSTITAALGISLVLGQGSLLIFGTIPRSIPAVFTGRYNIGGVLIGMDKVALIIMGVCVTLLIFWIFEKTTLGRSMRSVSFNPEVSNLMGINSDQIYMLTLGLGCALAGFAGAIIAPSYGIYPEMGNNILLPVLLMINLGGMDSLLGALVGGLVVGQVLSFGQFYIGGTVQIYLFIIIFVVLYFRPAGLLGRRSNIGM